MESTLMRQRRERHRRQSLSTPRRMQTQNHMRTIATRPHKPSARIDRQHNLPSPLSVSSSLADTRPLRRRDEKQKRTSPREDKLRIQPIGNRKRAHLHTTRLHHTNTPPDLKGKTRSKRVFTLKADFEHPLAIPPH